MAFHLYASIDAGNHRALVGSYDTEYDANRVCTMEKFCWSDIPAIEFQVTEVERETNITYAELVEKAASK